MAEQIAPNTMETHRARGLVLEITANYEESVREFEAAVAIDPNIADLHLALGRNYRALQLYDQAVQEFNRANALNPTDPMPLLLISRTYATVGEFAKAIQFAQQAIRANPTDPFLYGNLGTMYYRNRQYTDAVKALRTAIKGGLSEDGAEINGIPIDTAGRIPEYYSLYGLALGRTADCNEGLQISQLIQQALPNDETALFNAGEIINICQEVAKNPPTATLAIDLATETPAPLTMQTAPLGTPSPPTN
jgi:tetratricopeptide (TPR) repeat protein